MHKLNEETTRRKDSVRLVVSLRSNGQYRDGLLLRQRHGGNWMFCKLGDETVFLCDSDRSAVEV